MDSRLLTRDQVADLIGVSTRTVDQWSKDGLLTAIRLGGIVRFSKVEIDRLFFQEIKEEK